MLLSAQIFCTSAAQGYPSNVNGAPPWFTLINGKNLFETLVLNMVSIDETRVKFDDPPVIWRNSEIVESKRMSRRHPGCMECFSLPDAFTSFLTRMGVFPVYILVRV